jgi:hypothetical protein
VPAYSYVVRKKGVVEVGTGACANCHSRVLADGSYLRGAQGNFPVERAYAEQLRRAHLQKVPNRLAVGLLLSPEETDHWTEGLNRRSNEEIIATFDAMLPGVAMRPGFSYLDPPKIADLIGVRDRRYLDLTVRLTNRSVTDIAPYGSMCPSFNYFFTRGNAVPAATIAAVSDTMRYTDEQAYAFATYVYSLGSPPNPTRLRSSLGQDNTSSSGNGVHCATLRRSIRTTKLFRPVISRPRQVIEQSTPFSIFGLVLMRELG